jgi:hypothetical protein
MNIIDLDGNMSQWHLTGNISKGNLKKSSFHITARDLIKKIYPTMQILEEVPIHIRRSEILYLDFYLPLNKKCLEVHGQQHYEFVPFYHSNKLSFLKAKKRDLEKKEWCENNGLSYIELPYNKIEEWETLIANN